MRRGPKTYDIFLAPSIDAMLAALMTTASSRLPSRQWSIVALSSISMATVVLSYLLAMVLAVACLLLPVVLFVLVPMGSGSFLFARLLLSAFGLAAGVTVLGSLMPKREEIKVNGVPIDLKQEPRLAREIEAVAGALREPMPSEVYLIGDANAFVSEAGGRRVLALGLPLLQMLTIPQFRAVLAHEFAHYYSGDTRLGPWVYNTRRTMGRVYENLGRNSQVLRFLRRWAVVAGPYMLLMGALRVYWKLFMRVTQSISRRQELRCDELACHIAGSQALIDGLENIRKCVSALNPYWNSVVLPAAMRGFQPQLGDSFARYMHAPQIAQATTEFLAQQVTVTKPSPLDSHPPLSQRVERAKSYNLPAPEAAANEARRPTITVLPMITVIDHLHLLETSLLKQLVPGVANAELKPLNWETAGADVYVPGWRKNIEPFAAALAGRKMDELPTLILDPAPLAQMVPSPPGVRLNPAQRAGRALDVLYCALALCLLDNGWTLISVPGDIHLEKDGHRVEPSQVIREIRTGKLTVAGWIQYRAERGIGDWPLAAAAAAPVSAQA
jgi:heat shock protein HtpX